MHTTMDVERVGRKIMWLNELKCNGTEEHLWNCTWPGWDVSRYRKPSVKKITCSSEAELLAFYHFCLPKKKKSNILCYEGATRMMQNVRIT